MRKISALLFVLLSTVSISGIAVSSPKTEAAQSAAATAVKPTGETVKPIGEVAKAVNINTADAETLQRELKGIGKVKAEAIVAYREQNGPFTSVDQLLEVKGVGKALMERNRAMLSLE
ncbi:ComEA family DNA-binding protein [Pseudomonas sp. QL9]|uniref:ComEA family DNA-binding protein n=1 Tax=Pseudomonas sp. QL9 TaxID=3242725 RepID=UPI00352B58AA